MQSAEQNPYDRKTIDVNPTRHSLNEDLGDGWKVTGVDANLVTQVTKSFSFTEDDNDVIVTFDAMDNSLNRTKKVQSEKFTIDKTVPVINVAFREDDDTDMYYNQNRVADITVIERNFDEKLIKAEIQNMFGAVPEYSFTEKSNTEHTAVIDFDEGDYIFDLTGADLGEHPAIVNFSGGNEKMFYVDKTAPVVEENFAEFSNSAENSFNTDKTVNITITEHNFDPELLNLKIIRKEPGEEHSAQGNQDVLAFIMDSNLEEKTGVYSFEYENGEAISKKTSDFQDLKIFVMSKKASATDIVLRDSNGQEILTNAQCMEDDRIYGMGIYNYLLKSDFFRENFQDDTDVELQLTVKNQGCRIDLGKMHIDNIAPTCVMPGNLESWHWFYGETDRTFKLSSISELVDEEQCAIYDNGQTVPFVYSSEEGTITFTLAKGWHNVGIILDDMAGNANNIQERINLYIGYFWLWIIVALSAIVIAAAICIVIYSRNKRKQELD